MPKEIKKLILVIMAYKPKKEFTLAIKLSKLDEALVEVALCHFVAAFALRRQNFDHKIGRTFDAAELNTRSVLLRHEKQVGLNDIAGREDHVEWRDKQLAAAVSVKPCHEKVTETQNRALMRMIGRRNHE